MTVDFGDEKAQAVLMQTWDNHKITDLTPESLDCLWVELERYRRNPLNLTTEQLADIADRSKAAAKRVLDDARIDSDMLHKPVTI